MSYIYGAPILDVSRSHTTTQHIQLVAHMKSKKCCTAQHHTKQSDWRLMWKSDKVMCLYFSY